VNTSIKQRRGLLAAAGLALSVVLAGCGGDGDAPQAAEPQAAEPATVTLKLIAFKPERLTVAAGTTVRWTNADASDHTVTSGTVAQAAAGVTTSPDGTFDSGVLASAKDFTFAFQTPGTYPYFCQIHPATMRGEVTVT